MRISIHQTRIKKHHYFLSEKREVTYNMVPFMEVVKPDKISQCLVQGQRQDRKQIPRTVGGGLWEQERGREGAQGSIRNALYFMLGGRYTAVYFVIIP